MSTLTPLEHTAIGAFSGMLECCIMQPTVGIKNALQEGRPVPRDPLVLYRGLLVNAGSIAPVTAIQFGANKVFEQFATSMFGQELSQGGRIGVAAAAGAASALGSCPAELVMIQQQGSGRSLVAEAKHFLQTYKPRTLYRALPVTLFRESTYTASYMGICPVLREYLESHPALKDYPPSVPFIIAGTSAGLFAAVATQPADTIKTRMQANLDSASRPEYKDTVSTVRQIVGGGRSVSALFVGLLPRAVRIVGATFILNEARTRITGWVEASRPGVITALSEGSPGSA